MGQRLRLLALIVILVSGPGYGEWVPLRGGTAPSGAPTITLLEDNPVSTTIKVEVAGFEVNRFAVGGKSYQSIDLQTEMATNQVGSPEVPHVATMLIIPDKGDVTVEVLAAGEVRSFPGFTLPPAKPTSEEGKPEPGFVENEAAYGSSVLYPEMIVKTDEPAVFRDFRVMRVSVFPVRYIAATKEVQVASSLTIRLNHGGGHGVNPRTAMKRSIPPSFGIVYRNTFLNYRNVLDREYGGLETGRDVLLCIVPDTFATTFQTYRTWKHKSGTFVRFTRFSEIGANSSNPEIIRNYIAQCYHTWEYPPTYVLLGGDYGFVPIRAADGQSFASEDYFVEIDGNDVFPEAYIGRFTNSSNTELSTIINKVIKYERTPYRTNQDWFKHAVVTANNAWPTQPDTKRWVADIMKGSGGFLIDTLLNPYGGSCIYNLSQVIGAINSGRSFLNYRGEGSSSGWWASCYPFGTSDVSSLNNGEMLTFVTSIGCGVANFAASGGNCFGEQWLELGTPTTTRGACAFVGPTWGNTHTKYNNAIDKGIYVAMFQEGMETPAQTLLRGKIRMYDLYGGSDPYVIWHFRTYTVLGDPSTHIWKDVPRKANIVYSPYVGIGYDQVQVTVHDSVTLAPVAGAEIAIAGDSVYVTGVTDAAGVAIIPVTSPGIDTLSIVIRGGRVLPAEGTIQVISDQEHVAPFGNPVVTEVDGNHDGMINPNEHIQISYVLRNWGLQAASDVQATLSVIDTAWGTIVNGGPVFYGTLLPNASDTGTGTPLQFYVRPTTPVGSRLSLQLHITSTAHAWNYITQENVLGCNLEYSSTVVNDSGSSRRNGRLDPGETATLYFMVRNTGQDAAPGVAGILRSASPYITILDSIGSFGSIAIGDSAASITNAFMVRVSATCPIESLHDLRLLLSTQNGNYPYIVERTFTLSVGLPSVADPTGPDAYGYYAYSNEDILYEAAPKFQWVEIRSVGTRVPYVSPGDFTVTVNLPFTFKYYGVNFTTIRVSSDGWLAPGSGTQTSYANFPLPHDDNVTSMLAPFWDDLFEGSNNPTSKLLYYFDNANHRFIAEWDSVGHYGVTTLRESFQVILLDPAFYPTPTGDGEILFQYRMVGEEGSCTVGTENNLENIGLQYLYNSVYPASAAEIKDSTVIRWTTRPPTILTHTPGDVLVTLPEQYSISQNYPNPFNPATVIAYDLPFESRVSLRIYNILGQEVCTLVDEVQSAGHKTVVWDAQGQAGVRPASGVYFLHLKADGAKAGEGGNGRMFSAVRKMLLLK